jgi:predicted kinase
MKSVLYLMLGYPGAGKTTTARMIADITGAVRLSSDEMRLKMFPKPEFTEAEHKQLYQAIDKQTEELLAQGKSVIYDANLNRFVHRQEKYDICDRTGAKAVLIWLKTPVALSRKRATETGHTDPEKRPFGNLDTTVFDRLAGAIEMPKSTESAITIDGTHVTPEVVKQKLGL